MEIGTNWWNIEHDETQFTAIRDLMLDASMRGSWLTLAEIAESTEFGEASISAQLRHLRKPRFGHYRVEKRRREVGSNTSVDFAADADGDRSSEELRLSRSSASPTSELQRILEPWEYRVFAPQQSEPHAGFEAESLVSLLVEQLTRPQDTSPSQDRTLTVSENATGAPTEPSVDAAKEAALNGVADDGACDDVCHNAHLRNDTNLCNGTNLRNGTGAYDDACANLHINLRGGEVCDR